MNRTIRRLVPTVEALDARIAPTTMLAYAPTDPLEPLPLVMPPEPTLEERIDAMIDAQGDAIIIDVIQQMREAEAEAARKLYWQTHTLPEWPLPSPDVVDPDQPLFDSIMRSIQDAADAYNNANLPMHTFP